ncbi:MAG TPA: sigma-70 family RNA polymerase sigma factor [Ktedonobacteraceae bacterium]|jgi:RNA polymerase sigma-70 factor (ECF subfamily)|nr:sigma-70 family RNA polymerase sigma factor [Ktedonobacteraceae bacterium]
MSPSDEELVLRCKAELPGNTRSYELLVQRYMNRVYGIVYRVVGHREEAEDITQEVFVKVYNGLRKFEQQSSFATWLYRIATNSALDALDKIKRQRQMSFSPFTRPEKQETEEEISPDLQATPDNGPDEQVEQSELRECINHVLHKLDREQARLLILRDFDDRSYDEIAGILELGLSAVKMRIHRARLAFQQLFSQFCGSIHLSFSSPSNGSTQKTRTRKV